MYPYMYWACNPNQWIKNHNIQFTKIAPSFTLFSAYSFGLHFSSLTPMGLPLRLGEALCIFYSCYGFCKFGPGCKFDHLIDISKYNFSSSSSGTASLSCHQKNLMMQAKAGQFSLWESRQMPSGDDNIDTVKWRHKSFTFYGLLGLRKSYL